MLFLQVSLAFSHIQDLHHRLFENIVILLWFFHVFCLQQAQLQPLVIQDSVALVAVVVISIKKQSRYPPLYFTLFHTLGAVPCHHSDFSQQGIGLGLSKQNALQLINSASIVFLLFYSTSLSFLGHNFTVLLNFERLIHLSATGASIYCMSEKHLVFWVLFFLFSLRAADWQINLIDFLTEDSIHFAPLPLSVCLTPWGFLFNLFYLSLAFFAHLLTGLQILTYFWFVFGNIGMRCLICLQHHWNLLIAEG